VMKSLFFQTWLAKRHGFFQKHPKEIGEVPDFEGRQSFLWKGERAPEETGNNKRLQNKNGDGATRQMYDQRRGRSQRGKEIVDGNSDMET